MAAVENMVAGMSLSDCLAQCKESTYGFTMAPSYLLQFVKEFDLTPTEALLWLSILSYTRASSHSVFPAVSTLAENLNVSVRTIRTAIKALVLKGFMSVSPRQRENGSDTTNLYDPTPGARMLTLACIKKDPTLAQEYADREAREDENDVSRTSKQDADTAPHKDVQKDSCTSEQDAESAAPEVDKDVSSTFGTTGGRRSGRRPVVAADPTTEDPNDKVTTRKRPPPKTVADTTSLALETGKPSNILDFWRRQFEERLGRPCTAVRGAAAYSKIKTATSRVKSYSDLMVMMLYALDRRVDGEPLWGGAEIRDPTLGLFASEAASQTLMEGMMGSSKYRALRFGYAVQSLGQEEAEALYSPKELTALRGSMREYKKGAADEAPEH